MDEDNVKEIFDSCDAEGNGEISTEEFGSAIFKCLKTMKAEEEDNAAEEEAD